MSKSASSRFVASYGWEVELEIVDAGKLGNAWSSNQIFQLYVEFSAIDKGNPVIETIKGEVQIITIDYNLQKPCRAKGISTNLDFTSKEGEDWKTPEVVQFT